jgi:hypothetical protein
MRPAIDPHPFEREYSEGIERDGGRGTHAAKPPETPHECSHFRRASFSSPSLRAFTLSRKWVMLSPRRPAGEWSLMLMDGAKSGGCGGSWDSRTSFIERKFAACRADRRQLVGRWSEAVDIQAPYNPPWMRDAAKTALHWEDVSPLVLALDFRRLSPFGRGWFERALEGFTSRSTCRY